MTHDTQRWARRMLAVFMAFGCLIVGESAHSLPDGLSRYNPAGLSKDWQYEGTAFLALSAPRRVGSDVPVLRLKHPRKGYMFTTAKAEAATAERAGYLAEGTAFYVPSYSHIPVWRFRSPADGGVFYTASRDEGYAAHLRLDGIAFYAAERPSGERAGSGPESTVSSAVASVARYRNQVTGSELLTASNESPYRVGAFYFGAFTAGSTTVISGTQRVYGRSGDWWGGVKDFYGSEPGIPMDHRGWAGQWPDLKPAIGYYDQSKAETLEQHITQAADAGLSFFSFYWYWSGTKHDELSPEVLSSFLHARNLRRMKFNLTLYAHPWDDQLALYPAGYGEVARRLVSYFRNPQYLRLPDGRPVFSIGDDRNIRGAGGEKCADSACNQAALSAFLSVLRQLSLKALHLAPFVQIQVGVPAWDRQAEADGLTCQIPPLPAAGNSDGGIPYPELTSDVFARFLGPHKPISACMFENFDERPRQDVLISDRNAIRYFVGRTDELFRHNLTVAKNFSDSQFQATNNAASRIIYLYAWNEWHEGGILEPTAHSGARELNIVTDVFQLPRSASPCLDSGGCKLVSARY